MFLLFVHTPPKKWGTFEEQHSGKGKIKKPHRPWWQLLSINLKTWHYVVVGMYSGGHKACHDSWLKEWTKKSVVPNKSDIQVKHRWIYISAADYLFIFLLALILILVACVVKSRTGESTIRHCFSMTGLASVEAAACSDQMAPKTDISFRAVP